MTYPGEPKIEQSPRISATYVVPVERTKIAVAVRRAVQSTAGLAIIEVTADGAIVSGRRGVLPHGTIILEFEAVSAGSTRVSGRRPKGVWSGTDTLMREVFQSIKREIDRETAPRHE